MATATGIAFNVLRLTVAVLALVGNFLIVLVVMRNRNCRKFTCDLLIGLLSFCDYMLGLSSANMQQVIHSFLASCIILAATVELTHISTPLDGYYRLTCLAVNSSGIFGIVAGQIILLAMALDRLSAVAAPIKYSHRSQMVSTYADEALSKKVRLTMHFWTTAFPRAQLRSIH